VVTAVEDAERGVDPVATFFAGAESFTGAGFAGAAFLVEAAFELTADFAAGLAVPFDTFFFTAVAVFFGATFVGFDFGVALLGTLSSGVNERRETTSIELGSGEMWGGPSQRGRH
jgi:hypothetical protein